MRRTESWSAIALAFLIVPTVRGQATWHVDDDAAPPGNGSVSAPFSDIAPAIAAASSGDLILVSDGLYGGFDFSGKDVEVRSVGGAGATTIGVPPPSGRMIDVVTGEGAGAILDGFTVTGSTNELLLIGAASPTIRNCRFVGGGVSLGVWVDVASLPGNGPSFEDVEITSCHATDVVDWVGLTVLGPARFVRCSINGNSGWIGPVGGPGGPGGSGAGVRAHKGFLPIAAPPIFEDCEISGNVGGDGLIVGGSAGLVGDAELRRCRIVGNVGGYGVGDPGFGGLGYGGNGGAFPWPFGRLILEGCLAVANAPGGGDVEGIGGASPGATGKCLGCTFVGNGSRATLTGAWSGCIVRDNGPGALPPILGGPTSVSYCNLNGGAAGVGNFDAPESFMDVAAGDYRLRPDSPSIDAGDPAALGALASDLDGEPRIFGGRIDVGADESTGPLIAFPSASGNVGDATGANGPFDLVTINGSAGYSGRTVEVPVGASLTFAMAAPPGVAAPFSYALCGMFGVPTAGSPVTTPVGEFLFFPSPLDPSASGFFLLASDIAFPSPALVPTTAAPLAVTAPAGLPSPVTLTLQAAVVTGGASAGELRITNGVVLRVY